MASRTPTSPSRTPPFALFLLLWIGFGLALIFNQSVLDTVWRDFLAFPLLVQVAGWILFLPLTLALWIWESDWTLWLRLLLIVMIAIANLVLFNPVSQLRPATGYRRTTRHEIPPGSVGV